MTSRIFATPTRASHSLSIFPVPRCRVILTTAGAARSFRRAAARHSASGRPDELAAATVLHLHSGSGNVTDGKPGADDQHAQGGGTGEAVG